MKEFKILVDPLAPLNYNRIWKDILQPLQKFVRKNGLGDLLIEPGRISGELCRGKAFAIGRDSKDVEFPNLEFVLLEKGKGRATLYKKPNLMFAELNGPDYTHYSGNWSKLILLVIRFFQKEAKKQKSTADHLRKIQAVIKSLKD